MSEKLCAETFNGEERWNNFTTDILPWKWMVVLQSRNNLMLHLNEILQHEVWF